MFFQCFSTFNYIIITFDCISDVIIISEFMSISLFIISDSVKLFLFLIEIANLCCTYCIKLSFDCSAQIACFKLFNRYFCISCYLLIYQWVSKHELKCFNSVSKSTILNLKINESIINCVIDVYNCSVCCAIFDWVLLRLCIFRSSDWVTVYFLSS